MKPISRALIFSGLGAAALAAAVIAWNGASSTRRVYTDGSGIREPTDIARIRSILWQPPTGVSSLINSPADEYEGCVDPVHGQMLYFVRGKPDRNADIMFSVRTAEGWGEPQPVLGINTDADELGPSFSPDGLTLYFYSNREGGHGQFDLWRSKRVDGEWSAAENLGPGINSEWNEYNPSVSSDGRTMFFASNRPSAGELTSNTVTHWSATLRENSHAHDYDLYAAALVNDELGQPQPLPVINTAANEGAPAMSPAGDFLYFASDRAEGFGAYDLYRSRLLRGAWQEPENLGPQVNTAANELDPSLSMGGFAMHFSSNRASLVTSGLAETNDDVFYTVSREVFEEDEHLAATGINWASLLSALWPNLLWLLLLLLLLLLLARWLRSGRLKALSLLARCLLLSILAHVLLMMLLMIWGVTVGLAEAIRRGESSRVALTSDSVGQSQDIISQIRGDVTDLELLSQHESSERLDLQIETDQAAAPPTPVDIEHELAPPALAEASVIEPPAMTEAPVHQEESQQAPTVEVPLDPVQPIATRTPAMRQAVAMQEPSATTPPPPAPSMARSVIDDLIEDVSTPVDPIEPLSIPAITLTDTETPTRESTNEIEDAASPRVDPQAPSIVELDVCVRESAIAVPLPRSTAAVSRVQDDESAPSMKVPTAEPMATRRPTATVAMDVPQLKTSPDEELALPAHDLNVQETSVVQPVTRDAVEAAAPAMSFEAASATSLDSPAPVPMVVVPSPAAAMTQAAKSEPAMEPQPAPVAAHAPVERTHQNPAIDQANLASELSRPQESSSPVDIDDRRSMVPDRQHAVADASPASTASPIAMLDANVSAIPLPMLTNDVPLRLPKAIAPPVEAYRQRAAENRLELVKELGGSEATERAVELALNWFARHQSADGRWDADHFDDQCGRCGNPAKFDADVATTGLALMCFYAANHTHVKDGPYRSVVQRGIDWLMSQQRPSGDLRGNETMYSHGIGSIALSEAYGMTRDERLLPHVRRAVDYIVRARDTSGRDGSPAAGGWRYEPGQPGDTSVLGWQVMALVSASRAGIDVPEEALNASRNWLDRVSTQSNPGLYAYQPGERFTVAMTAEGMFSQQLLGRRREEPRMLDSAQFIMRSLPKWDFEPNSYYWYYATMALFQHQGEPWKQWNAALTEQLLEHQHTKGANAGSWDPVDRWSKIGGRVYQTAMCTLSLEVYYRYLPLYGSAGQ